MKKIFLSICILSSLIASSQVKQKPVSYGVQYRRVQADSAIRIPTVQVGIKDQYLGFDTAQLWYDKTDSTVEVYTGSQWIALAGGTTVTASNGLTKSVNDVKLGGLLTGQTIIEGSGNNFFLYNLGATTIRNTSTTATLLSSSNGTDSSYLSLRRGNVISQKEAILAQRTGGYLAQLGLGEGIGLIDLRTTSAGVWTTFISLQNDMWQYVKSEETGRASEIYMLPDSITFRPSLGQLNIDTLRSATDTTTRKPMVWSPATGRWEYLTFWPGGGGGTPALTSTQVAYGDGSNLMTSSTALKFLPSHLYQNLEIAGASSSGIYLNPQGTGGRKYVVGASNNDLGIGGGWYFVLDESGGRYAFGINSTGETIIMGAAGTTTDNGSYDFQVNGTSYISGDLTVGGLKHLRITATDADATIAATTGFEILPTISANRNVTFPAQSAGKRIVVWNKNSAGFTWNITGTVVDAADGAITSLVNDTMYEFISDGTSWVKLK